MKKIILALFLCIFLFSFVASTDFYVKQGDPYDIKTSCVSAGGSFCITGTTCNITANYGNSTNFINNQRMEDLENGYFNYSLTEDQTIINGIYSGRIGCNYEGDNATSDFTFEINPLGEELTQSKAILYFGLLVILTLFFGISLYLLFTIENYKSKFALYWTSHLLAVALTFVLWNGSSIFLSDVLFLTVFFRILWFVIIIAVIPMFFLSIAWIFYIHTFNEHFEKLISKGEHPETAFRMAKRKSGGWLHGK